MKRRAMLAGLCFALSGCVTVPSTGDVRRVDASGLAQDPRLLSGVDPPEDGAPPDRIVRGFLAAMANYQPNYEVAREYLTSEGRDGWQPESGVQIIADSNNLDASEESAVMRASLTGEIADDGTYAPARGTIRFDFGLIRDPAGEWRISKPPSGLLITRYDFDKYYSQVNLYFFEPGLTSLVPNPIHIPESAISASVVARRMLAGPSEWLSPAVTTAFPNRTPAGVAVQVDQAGVATFALDDAATSLTPEQRRLLAGQTVWTLRQVPRVRQVPQVRGLRFEVNGAGFEVPGAVDGVVPVDAMTEFAPVDPHISTQLFAATEEGVVRLAEDDEPVPVDGPLGSLQGIEDLAVAPEGDQVAAVVAGRTEVRAGVLGDRQPTAIVTGEQELARPQYTRFGELLVQGEHDGAVTVWLAYEEAVQPVTVELPFGMTLQAFRVAPDGVRVAVVAADADGVAHLGLMLMLRAGAPALTSFREVPVVLSTGARLVAITDVAWSSATDLVVLGATSAESRAQTYLLSEDGAAVSNVGAPDGAAVERLVTSQRRTTESGGTVTAKVALLGAEGRAWRFNDDWVELPTRCQALAFPG